jgi:molybdopterin/thiamine biosynthesis adenylyltransferase
VSELTPYLEAEILAASHPLDLPGMGERRVLSPVAVDRLASVAGWPRWQLEAAALDAGVTPLHYVRNLARHGVEGQLKLLRARVGLVGEGPALERAAELLGLAGVGRFLVLAADEAALARQQVERFARNRNASCEVDAALLPLRGGNPAGALTDLHAVAACLPGQQDEQLLQFACRIARLPLVLGAVEDARGQALTVFPGESGVAGLYKPQNSHLSPDRADAIQDPRAAIVIGGWMAEELIQLVLEERSALRGRARYADVDAGEIHEYGI